MKEESQAHRAYSEIRRKVLSNQLLPNTRLKEDAWAKQLGVNRMAIREALTRLLGEQMLLKGERGGFFVKGFSIKDVSEIREIREILEYGAIKLIIEQDDVKPIVARLLTICNDYKNMVEKGYFGGACEADLKFHETLIEESGNQKLIELYKVSNIPLFHQKIVQAQSDSNDYGITETEHMALVAAIEKKDLSQARAVLEKHLARGESLVLDVS